MRGSSCLQSAGQIVESQVLASQGQALRLLAFDLHIPTIRPRVLRGTSHKTSKSQVARRDRACQ